MKPCARSSALLAQASQHLWLVLYHDVYQEFTYVHHTLHPAPSPPDAGRYTVSSRFGCQSGDCGYVVRGHLTARYLAAVPRRILLMEQQVWSMPDDQPCDLVSQHPITGWHSLFPTPIPALPSAPLTIRFPPLRRSTGLPRSAYVPLDGLGTTCSPVGSSSAIGEGGAPIPPHLPFGSRLSAPLPCWFSRRLLVVHICFPYHPTLAPDRLDAGSRNLSSRFGCHAVA